MAKGIGLRAVIVSLGTLASRILGFVRDLVIARIFGADALTDAFFVAFRIPNLLRRLFAEGAFAGAWVPVLSTTKTQEGLDSAFALIRSTLTYLALITTAITLLSWVAMPWVIAVFAPGFDDPHQFDEAVAMGRIVFPYLIFIVLVAASGGILNTFDRFAVPAWTPIWLNVAMIAMSFWGLEWFPEPIHALAWGVVIGGFFQLVFQIRPLLKLGLSLRPTLVVHNAMGRLLKLMAPMAFGAGVYQINLLVSTMLASLVGAGAISWLYYADRLLQFPLGIIAIAIGTAVLPLMSRAAATGSEELLRDHYRSGMHLVQVWTLPAAVGLGLLADPIVRLLFGSGAFNAQAVTMTAWALIAYVPGLVALSLVKVMTPVFYSHEQTKRPTVIGIGVMIANMAISVPLMLLWGHIGLALATSISGWIQVVWLWWEINRDFPHLKTSPLILIGHLRPWIGTALMGALVLVGMGRVHLAILIPVAGLLYLGTLLLLRDPALDLLKSKLLKRAPSR